MRRVLKLVEGDCIGPGPEYFRDEWLIGSKASYELSPVDESVEKFYEEMVSKCETLSEVIDVFSHLEQHNLNVVSFDGIRVFRVSEQKKILQQMLETGFSKDKPMVFDVRWFNRTLGIRQKVSDVVVKHLKDKGVFDK